MAEWLYEAGIGEARAALVEGDTILEALIEPDSDGPRAGAIVAARLVRILIPGRRGILMLESGGEALIEPIPRGLTEGAILLAEILREAIGESGRAKLAKARVAADGASPCAGPDLLARIGAGPYRVTRLTAPLVDRLEQSGWSELLEEAATGEIGFPGGALRLAITPAMTLIDVDGTLPPEALAVAGARAAGLAIRRLGLAGSIGIDLPTIAGRAERQAAAAAFDDVLPKPFERTAINGFGFLQIVRRRTHASLAEVMQHESATAAARALLRRAERTPGAGLRTLIAAPAVIAQLEARPGWIASLSARIGAPVALRPRVGIAISAGHVEAQHP